jgi:hypothetical protein
MAVKAFAVFYAVRGGEDEDWNGTTFEALFADLDEALGYVCAHPLYKGMDRVTCCDAPDLHDTSYCNPFGSFVVEFVQGTDRREVAVFADPSDGYVVCRNHGDGEDE